MKRTQRDKARLLILNIKAHTLEIQMAIANADTFRHCGHQDSAKKWDEHVIKNTKIIEKEQNKLLKLIKKGGDIK